MNFHFPVITISIMFQITVESNNHFFALNSRFCFADKRKRGRRHTNKRIWRNVRFISVTPVAYIPCRIIRVMPKRVSIFSLRVCIFFLRALHRFRGKGKQIKIAKIPERKIDRHSDMRAGKIKDIFDKKNVYTGKSLRWNCARLLRE